MPPRTWIERGLQHWWRWSRGLTLGVRVLAVDPHGRIGFVRHTYIEGWHLPGGGVEKGELAITAAERELHEETGAAPDSAFVLRSIHANHARFPNDHVLVFSTTVPHAPDRAPDREIAEVAWEKPQNALQTVTPATARRLQEFIENTAPSPHW